MKRLFLAIVLSVLPIYACAMPTAEDIDRQIGRGEYSRALTLAEENGFLSLWETDIKASVADSIAAHKSAFLTLLAAILLYALMRALSGEHKGSVFLGKLVLSAVCLEHVTAEMTLVASAVREIAGLIEVLLPLLCVLTAASGGSFRAVSVQTVGLLCAEVGAAVIGGVVIPLAVFSFAVHVFHGMGEISLQGVARFFSSLGKWILGLVMSFFVGALAISGFAAGAKDTMAMKTAKFLTGSLVPVVGTALSQAADSVAASAGLLRGTVGTAGLIAVVLYLLKPVVRLLIVMLFYRVLAGAADMLGGDGGHVFSATADTFGFLIGCVAAMGVMAFLSIAVLLGGVGA